MENIYDFSPNFIDIGNYDDKQLLLWEVHVSDTRLVNCQVWEVPTYGHFSMSDSELDNFAALLRKSVELNSKLAI